MSTTKSHTKWLGGLAFESTNPGGTITIDASVEQGGTDSGLRPKALMLNSLAGCSAMDIANLVGKMRAEIYLWLGVKVYCITYVFKIREQTRLSM